MTDFSTAQKLDAREAHFRIPGPRQGLSLFLRYLAAANTEFRPRRAVLYVHGATFPSALSIAHRFDGRSWRDALNDAGFDVWGLDFYGFGHSDRYGEMNQPAANNLPLCVAEDAAEQVAAAVQFILARENIGRISLIAHSWGSMPACELHWSGKMGLIFGCTEAYDEHYGVIGSLGDRFLLYRLEPDYAGQLKKALDHRGKTTKTMRDELASAVVALFATPVNEPEGMTDAEVERLDAVCGLGHPSSRSCRP